MKNSTLLTISTLALVALATPTRAQVSAQIPFSDTFSGILQNDVFLDISAWRTDTGSLNGGQFGNTRIQYNQEINNSQVYGFASTQAPGFFLAKNLANLAVQNLDNSFNINSTQSFANLPPQSLEESRYTVQSSHGTRTTVEFFSDSGVTPVRGRFKWDISGSFSNTHPNVSGGGTLRFAAGNFDSLDYYDFFNLSTQENGGPLLLLDGTGTAFYDIPILLNQPIDLFYHSVAYVSGNAEVGESISGVADFSNTFLLDRIDLYDANDNLIPSWGMRDNESGLVMFDQNGRTAAANGNNIPEPGALGLLALGGVALLGRAYPPRRKGSRLR